METYEGAGSRKVKISFNLPFLTTILGVFKLVELLLSCVFCGLVNQYCMSSGCYTASRLLSAYPGLGFELFVGFVALIFTFILLLLHIFLATLFYRQIYILTEFGFTFLTGFMFLICVCIHATYADKMKGTPAFAQFVSATVFAALLMLLYGADSVIQYRLQH